MNSIKSKVGEVWMLNYVGEKTKRLICGLNFCLLTKADSSQKKLIKTEYVRKALNFGVN